MKNTWSFRSFIIWIAIGMFAYGLFLTSQGKKTDKYYLSVRFSDFVKDVQAGRVKEAKISNLTNEIFIDYKNTDTSAVVRYPEKDYDLISRLLNNKVDVQVIRNDPFDSIFWINLLTAWLPNILLFVFLFYANMGRGSFGFNKSKAKKVNEKEKLITFNDVAGLPEAKDELIEIVDFLKHPDKFARLGAKIPKGVLLYGPPGTGKTLLAKAIAGEARVPFLYVSGAEFVEVFVGIGASRVRDIFAQARKYGKCIIFIDELDSIGKKRNSIHANEERENTLNQLLVELDGFDTNTGIIVVGATNRADVLDPALLRPGRFDRLIPIPLPDARGREEILRVHLSRAVVDTNGVDLKYIIYGSVGMAGAELADIVNRAAILAARDKRNNIITDDLKNAMEELILGSKRSIVMDEMERKLTAYHEAGHAIINLNTKYSNPIFKATITPTGKALGMVVSLPTKDELSKSKAQYLDQICVGLGGRIAEEITFGPDLITSGASSDIVMVTNLASSMVIKYGMSDNIGFLNYESDSYGLYTNSRASEETLKLIDSEIRKIVEIEQQRAKKIIMENMQGYERLAQALLQYETLNTTEIDHVIKYGTLDEYEHLGQTSENRYIFKPGDPIKRIQEDDASTDAGSIKDSAAEDSDFSEEE